MRKYCWNWSLWWYTNIFICYNAYLDSCKQPSNMEYVHIYSMITEGLGELSEASIYLPRQKWLTLRETTVFIMDMYSQSIEGLLRGGCFLKQPTSLKKASVELRTEGVSHKIIPYQFRIIGNKRLIYLRGKLTNHCSRLQPSEGTGTESNNRKWELEAGKQAHGYCCFL